MTAKKRVISIITIISLVLAIMVGVLLTAQISSQGSYIGDNIAYSNTNFTIDASSSVNVVNNFVDGAVEIASEENLQNFIREEGDYAGTTYGYLTADIELDWSGVGSQSYLANGRTIDGNGHTVTLKDAQATALVSNPTTDSISYSGSDGIVSGIQGGFTDPLDGSTDSAIRNYGMFVDFNMGTIKNIKFEFNQTSHSVVNNDSIIGRNYVGIICGTNSGTISNCDLTVSGKFGYYYCRGSLSTSNYDNGGQAKLGFSTMFGGVTGRNGGIITNITAQYTGFNLELNTYAKNSTGSWVTVQQRADARVDAGGIAGVMYSKDSECSNIIILASSDVAFKLNAHRNNLTIGGDGVAYREVAAVVPDNSSYSMAEGGIGDSAETQGKIDNIIVDFNVELSGFTVTTGDDYASINGVVYCGATTNVTILGKPSKAVDCETDMCGCGTDSNPGQHNTGFGNIVSVDENATVKVGFDENNNQVIEIIPNDSVILGEVTFNKYNKRGDLSDGDLQVGIPDEEPYEDVEDDFARELYNKVDVRTEKYTFVINPYQETPYKFWELNCTIYELITLRQAGESQNTYNGSDFLLEFLGYDTLSGSRSGFVNVEYYNAVSTTGTEVKEAKLPGEYTFTLQEVEDGFSYLDTENRLAAFVEEEPTEYALTINLAQIVPIAEEYLANNWITVATDFNFELDGGIEGAADGYSYTVNGSLPNPVKGLVMQNKIDSDDNGRTYTVYLTSGGVQVTEAYTYTVKIDVTDPTLDVIDYEHPADRYYTHNTIKFSATDEASGVYSIIMNSYNKTTGELDHSHDLMQEATLNDDGTYSWRFQDTGRKEIIVIDNVGHTSAVELNVQIDNTVPTLDVEAFYMSRERYVEYDDEGHVITDIEGNPIYKYRYVETPYESGTQVTSAVYFRANATFGESGGEIRYSLDNGDTWQVYTGVITVKTNADVMFRAVSNTYTHPEDDEYPYPNRYPLVNNWDNKTVEVRIQLEEIVITLDDLVIENAAKTFDGTNQFFGNVSVREGFLEEHDINGEVQITSVVYANINANDIVAIEISVFCTDDTKIMVNQIEGATGSIEKKVVDVTIDDQVKIYGVSLPQLTYTQSGMVAGFEEQVSLYVQKPDGYTGSYELLPQTANGEGYVITVVDGMTLTNYTLGVVTDARLRVTLAPIDRLVYERGQFTGLDTNNIADRNLEIGFIRSNGNYEKLNVEFYARDYYYDTSSGETIDLGYTLKVNDITTAKAGFYKVVISLPKFAATGEALGDKYEMDADITEFYIKIIDASIFDSKDEQIESGDVNAEVGIYENDSTNTDNTDVAIDVEQQRKDYVAIIAIFCAVAIMIAFAIGVGRVIVKRIRR